MRFLSRSLLSLSLGFLLSRSEEEVASPSLVVSLTEANFDEVLQEAGTGLVYFYAPWCGHCKSFSPEIEKVAKKAEDLAIVAQVDATSESSLSERFSIEGFPTLFLFKNGVNVDTYKGERTAEAVYAWLMENLESIFPEISESDLALKTSAAHKMWRNTFVLRLPSGEVEGSVAWETMNETVQSIPKRGRWDQSEEEYTGVMGKETLKTWILQESFALFGEINADNYESIAAEEELDFNLGWLIVDADPTAKDSVSVFREEVLEAAKQTRGSTYFVYLDRKEYPEHAEMYLGCNEPPCLVLQTDLKARAHRYVWKIEQASHLKGPLILSFIEDAGKGLMKPYLRSAEVPESNDGPVLEVVGKTLEDLFDNEKDALLEVYAPWCGHCQRLAPAYTHFARMVNAQLPGGDLRVAKMDGTNNESPLDEVQWDAFPTIYFIKAGSRNATVYDGPHTLDGLLDFVKSLSALPAVQGLEMLSGPLDFLELREYLKTLPQGDKVTQQIQELLKEHDRERSSDLTKEPDMDALASDDFIDDLDDDEDFDFPESEEEL